jgi:hypothetical protein
MSFEKCRGFTLFIPFDESSFMIHWWIRQMNLFRYVMLSSLEHSKTSLWSLRFANFCFHAKWHNILKWHILRQKVWFYVLIIIYFSVPQRTPTTSLLTWRALGLRWILIFLYRTRFPCIINIRRLEGQFLGLPDGWPDGPKSNRNQSNW